MIYWSLLIFKRIDARSKEDDKSYISPFYFITSYITKSFCWCDVSHVQYSSVGSCLSLACGHRCISGRRFSSPKWVERSDGRKYVCVRRLAVPKRHNICSSSSSLATSSTCNHAFPQAAGHHSKGTKGFLIPNPFKFPFQILVLFQLFLRDSCVEVTRNIYFENFFSFLSITTTSGLFLLFDSPLLNLFIPLSPTSFYSPTRASQQTLLWIVLRDAR